MRNVIQVAIGVLLALASCREQPAREGSAGVPGAPPKPAPEGMVYIPEGTFMMGGKSFQAEPDELPRRAVQVSAFYMDQTEVTNRQFAAFVEATGYVTTAEKPIDWEEIKTQLPPGTPKPPDSVLQPG